MAQINGIWQNGELNEFVDEEARKLATSFDGRISRLAAKHEQDLLDEIERAKAVEAQLNAEKMDKADGKGFSTYDFDDYYKNKIDNPPVMRGATANLNGGVGNVPQPMAGDQNNFLRGDGKWVVPTDTTYDNASHTAAGLMSTADKIKLDAVDQEVDDIVGSNVTFGDGTITENLATGKTKVTTFNLDGSIDEVISKDGMSTIHLHTVFNADGSITRTRRVGD